MARTWSLRVLVLVCLLRNGNAEPKKGYPRDSDAIYKHDVTMRSISCRHQCSLGASEKLVISSYGLMISSPELCADPAPVQEPNVPSEASHIMTRQVLVRLVVSSSLCSSSLCPGIPDDPILSWLPASYILGALSFMGYFATPCRGTDNGAILICPVKGSLRKNQNSKRPTQGPVEA